MVLSKFIEGLQIIQKHEKDGFCLRAEHDQFWASSTKLEMPPDDKVKLIELGWLQDDDADGWLANI